jgi:hypothetical protein
MASFIFRKFGVLPQLSAPTGLSEQGGDLDYGFPASNGSFATHVKLYVDGDYLDTIATPAGPVTIILSTYSIFENMVTYAIQLKCVSQFFEDSPLSTALNYEHHG